VDTNRLPADEPAPRRTRRRWVPWQRDRERHVSGAVVSVLFHLGLLLLFASMTFGPGSGLIGQGAAGLGEASVQVSDAQQDNLDARQLLKEMTLEPRAVPEQQRAVRPLPRLASLGAAPSSLDRLKGLTATFSAGGVGNLSGEFGSLIGKLRKSGLDVVLVVDATGSMQQVLDELTARMSGMAAGLQRLVPAARIGAVAYRDQGEAYTTRYTALTLQGKKVREFLASLNAAGGGDWEDGVLPGLQSAINDLDWRPDSKKVIILVGSSPPHPEEMETVGHLVAGFHAKGGIVSTIDITQRLHEESYRFLHKSIHGGEPTSFPPPPEHFAQVATAFRDIARRGGGEMAGVGWDKELAEQVLVFAFGSRWRDQVLAAGKEQPAKPQKGSR
jgi:hypothetical protein